MDCQKSLFPHNHGASNSSPSHLQSSAIQHKDSILSEKNIFHDTKVQENDKSVFLPMTTSVQKREISIPSDNNIHITSEDIDRKNLEVLGSEIRQCLFIFRNMIQENSHVFFHIISILSLQKKYHEQYKQSLSCFIDIINKFSVSDFEIQHISAHSSKNFPEIIQEIIQTYHDILKNFKDSIKNINTVILKQLTPEEFDTIKKKYYDCIKFMKTKLEREYDQQKKEIETYSHTRKEDNNHKNLLFLMQKFDEEYKNLTLSLQKLQRVAPNDINLQHIIALLNTAQYFFHLQQTTQSLKTDEKNDIPILPSKVSHLEEIKSMQKAMHNHVESCKNLKDKLHFYKLRFMSMEEVKHKQEKKQGADFHKEQQIIDCLLEEYFSLEEERLQKELLLRHQCELDHYSFKSYQSPLRNMLEYFTKKYKELEEILKKQEIFFHQLVSENCIEPYEIMHTFSVDLIITEDEKKLHKKIGSMLSKIIIHSLSAKQQDITSLDAYKKQLLSFLKDLECERLKLNILSNLSYYSPHSCPQHYIREIALRFQSEMKKMNEAMQKVELSFQVE